MANLPEGMNPALTSQFLKIQQAFVAGLAQRMRDIEGAKDQQARYAALHRLAGAAGGYGFDELSTIAHSTMVAMDSRSPCNLDVKLASLKVTVASIMHAY